MIYYFIGSLLVGGVLFMLGSYTTIVSMLATAGKAVLALLLLAGIILLIRKFIINT